MASIRLAIAALLIVAGLITPTFAQTVIVVSHAEQDRSVPGGDPPLSAAGQARAPAIVAGLGGKPAVDLPEAVYDTLTTVRIDGGSVSEIDSRYGAPTP